MLNKTIIIFFLIFAFSCKKKNEWIRYTYHENGAIKEKYVYSSKDNIDDFKAYLYSIDNVLIKETEIKDNLFDGKSKIYYKNGNLREIIHYKKGIQNGKRYMFHDNGNLFQTLSYENDTLHGIVKKFDKEEQLKEEFFYIKGKQVVFKEFFKSIDGKYAKTTYNLVSDTAYYELGQLVYSVKDKVPVDEMSFMYLVNSPDSVDVNDKCTIEILFIDDQDWDLELFVGELNQNLNFVNKPILINESNDVLRFTVDTKKKGYNLIMGKLFISSHKMDLDKDHENIEFVVYIDFFVRD